MRKWIVAGVVVLAVVGLAATLYIQHHNDELKLDRVADTACLSLEADPPSKWDADIDAAKLAWVMAEGGDASGLSARMEDACPATMHRVTGP